MVPPIVGRDLAVATMIRRERDLSSVWAPGSVAVYRQMRICQRRSTRPLWTELWVRESPGS